MTEFTATSRGEAARKIVEIDQEIYKEASNFNAKRTIPLLLCLEDAIDNLSNEIIRTSPAANVHPLLNQAVNNLVVEWYKMIDKMIRLIVKNGYYDETTKIELAGISIGVFIGSQLEQKQDVDSFLRALRSKGEIGRNPT
ncbi:MAG: hypothetical protein M1167_03250 [Chloroflexi bacterium]|nr:hypothetical protein [Chloroflexota bacterium]